MSPKDQPRERYTHGYSDANVLLHASRTAPSNAAFLLPYLKPKMNLIDLGCGQGTITIGFAKAVSPGTAIGIDINAGFIEFARRKAAEAGVTNARFETGSV